jgi:hypothetical protein
MVADPCAEQNLEDEGCFSSAEQRQLLKLVISVAVQMQLMPLRTGQTNVKKAMTRETAHGCTRGAKP